MRRAVWGLVATTVVGAFVGLFAAGAGAGGEAPADDGIAALRDLIPADPPGEDEDLDPDVVEAILDEIEGLAGTPAGGGSSLTGPCGGFAISYGPDGLLDAAVDAGDGNPPIDVLDGTQGFTSGNRFKVHSDGFVVWGGFMPKAGDGPTDHNWEYTVGGVPADSGGSENSDKDNTSSGVVDVAGVLPFGINLTTSVDGFLQPGDGMERCAGDGEIEIDGPLFGPLGILGFGLVAGGAAGLAFGARPKEV